MDKRIVVIGSSNIDMIIKSEKIPMPGETVIGGSFFKAAGGKGANQAVAAARAGGQVTFVASVGDDSFGHEAIQGFRKDQIDVRFVKVDHEETSGVALILVDRLGENSISVATGANAALRPKDIDRAEPVIAEADVVLLQLETPMDTIIHSAKMADRLGKPVILNPAPAQKLSAELLAHVSILTPNQLEAQLLTGIEINSIIDAKRAAKQLLSKGVNVIVVTLGSKGALLVTDGLQEVVTGYQVYAEDTTGAGDAFNGALAVAIAENRSLEEAVRFANAAGALAVTRLGAQPSAPNRKEIEILLRSPH